jgi:hypothetical protein
LSPPLRELEILVAVLLLSLLAVPWLIWRVGHSVLGPYSSGGGGAFFRDFFYGLSHGDVLFWLALIGPGAFLIAFRLLLKSRKTV